MTYKDQFEEMGRQRPADCELCEAMCPDAVDGTLTDAERRVFDAHIAACAACARELEQAQLGAAWLGMLKGHTPEPPAQLLAKILAETTGAEAATTTNAAIPALHDAPAAIPAPVLAPALAPAPEPAPAWALSSLLRRAFGSLGLGGDGRSLQPRLAMTAAMAFFSIAMTLSMTGVRLQDMRWSDLTPSGLRRTVANASASAERGFQNMRVVYQVESRVSEMRGEGPLAERDVQYAEPQPSAPGAQNHAPERQSAPPADGKARYKPL